MSTTALRGDDTTPRWQKELAQAVRDPAELLALLGLDPDLLPGARRAAELFPLRVPRGYVARMRHGDSRDPLLLQVLPLAAEAAPQPGFRADPVGDLAAMQAGGVLHKYHGRVLLIATGACAIHCRYCFRRHFPYAQANAAAEAWEPALDYLRGHPEISEVILSGGDPLALTDRRLEQLLLALQQIPHLRRLRVHSRLPIVLPQRVTEQMLAWLTRGRLQPVLVVHANHPNEIDASVADALARLREAGVTLLNQTVLLKGINDDVDTLVSLSERLFEHGVLPYYLHLLDPVVGAGHFDIPTAEGKRLASQMTSRLPGYLVPKLVREEPGRDSKTLLSPSGE
jgi:EF-P beta-lysylation protein EpmB